jgi:hypothetical protein
MNPYLDKAQGWSIVAGQELTMGSKKVCRYMLTENGRNKKFAILVADGATPTAWRTHLEGEGKTVLKEWDKIDGTGDRELRGFRS